MTYEEAISHLEVTPREARAEIEAHGQSWDEYVEAFGVQSVYYSDDILEWLGY